MDSLDYKRISVGGEAVNEWCIKCKYRDFDQIDEPCCFCVFQPGDKWEPKESTLESVHCDNCKYHGRAVTEEPCFHCDAVNHSGFEPAKVVSSPEDDNDKYMRMAARILDKETAEKHILHNALVLLLMYCESNNEEYKEIAKKYSKFYSEMTEGKGER